jgi:hypothetical protein
MQDGRPVLLRRILESCSELKVEVTYEEGRGALGQSGGQLGWAWSKVWGFVQFSGVYLSFV